MNYILNTEQLLESLDFMHLKTTKLLSRPIKQAHWTLVMLKDLEIDSIWPEEIWKVYFSFADSYCIETQISPKQHLVTYVLTKRLICTGGLM